MSTHEPILQAAGLHKYFTDGGRWFGGNRQVVKAVDGIDFTVNRGVTVGLVGESGCGKSTVGRLLLGLLNPTRGTVALMGQDITGLSRSSLRPLRTKMQIVFQDPFLSLNPRHRVGKILAAPFQIHEKMFEAGQQTADRVAALMVKVGLDPNDMTKFPHQFSGGQRQRIGIARAIALDPAIVVCDEPVSALDVSVQAQIINLLQKLQADLGLSLVFISHDLAVVEHISHRVAVMYLGQIVEFAERDLLFNNPAHPYTKALMSAIPIPDPTRARGRRVAIVGEIPSAINIPPGCRFHTRCPLADDQCRTVSPQLSPRKDGRLVSCHKN
jgi:oligopeptide/dipeptide ABC transporter ATP-binding protein